jgi:hypothetical protein
MTRAEGLTVIRELHRMEEIYRFRVALKQGLITWAQEATTTYKEAKTLSEEAERMGVDLVAERQSLLLFNAENDSMLQRERARIDRLLEETRSRLRKQLNPLNIAS